MAKTHNNGAPEIWRSLYQAARTFNSLKPWTWATEHDIFGVENYESGEIGYCCVMGELEEVFGLAVYLGDEGFETYATIQAGTVDIHDPEVINLHHCLLATFEDRDTLDKNEHKQIKELGLKFRGRNMWPQFRSMLPGYVPWYLTDDEARFLTVVLEQASDVLLRFKNNPHILTAPEEDWILIRARSGNGDDLVWEDEWLDLEVDPASDPAPPPKIDDLRIQRIKKQARKNKDVWEFGTFFAPTPVDEGDRPYFPRAFVFMDHRSGLALHTYLDHPERYLEPFHENILNFFEGNESIPQQILVSSPGDLNILEPIVSRLDISLEPVPILECVEDFRMHLYEAFL